MPGKLNQSTEVLVCWKQQAVDVLGVEQGLGGGDPVRVFVLIL